MLDIKYIREHQEEIAANSVARLAKADIGLLLKLDSEKRLLETEVMDLRASRNKTSKTKPTDEEIAQMKEVGDTIQVKEGEINALEAKVRELLLAVPNLTNPEVIVSQDEDDNAILDQIGEVTSFDFAPKDHVELAEALDLIDFERGTKVSGAKFYYLKGDLARLELALINYTLDIVTAHGYQLMTTPDLAKTEIVERLGFSPRGESTQVYNIENSDLSLIGTAEITLGGLYADEVLDLEKLPIKLVGLSHCFRTEAGSYSKFSKGIFRVHQFSKVEMFVFATPEQSTQLHQEILEIEKEIFAGLALPFRVVDHCTADLGNPSYRTFDLEAWMPGKPNQDGSAGDWAEVTSTSNCTDYQARGLNIKYKTADDKKELVHTLNGTGVATTRALIAIMENCQQADGSIAIPKKLIPYFGKENIS
ncbi:MAG: serine--tRNA ligase [Candidatus Falkowbacteria bacterium]